MRARVKRELVRVPGALPLARLTIETIRVCLRYRVTGLASEAGFFALLSLPPLVLGLFGGVGYVGHWLGPHTVDNVTGTIQEWASRYLTQDINQDLLGPTVKDVLGDGRFDLISVGFLLSVWSGSRALNVFVDTISIMYGQSGIRGIVRTRALSLTLYALALVVGIIVIPLVLIGPTWLGQILPDSLQFLTTLYWPVVTVLAVASLTTLYHVATPRRSPWTRDLPGALLTLVIWALASFVVRGSIAASLGGTSIYGPLSAPIVLLIWLYALAIAILIGAALNASIRTLWPAEERVSFPSQLGHRLKRRLFPRTAAPDGPDAPGDQGDEGDDGDQWDQGEPGKQEHGKQEPVEQEAPAGREVVSEAVVTARAASDAGLERTPSEGQAAHRTPAARRSRSLAAVPEEGDEGAEQSQFGNDEEDRLMSVRTHSR